MAVQRSDIQRWRRNAKADGRTTASAQLDWLETKRQIYADQVAALDQFVTADSVEGASTQGGRSRTNKDEHDAVLAAIEQIESDEGIGSSVRGALLGFRINNITG